MNFVEDITRNTNTEQGIMVEKGQVWQHYNGVMYLVLILANTEGDNLMKREKYPETVVYRGVNGKVWSRRLDDWHRSMTFMGWHIGEDHGTKDVQRSSTDQ